MDKNLFPMCLLFGGSTVHVIHVYSSTVGGGREGGGREGGREGGKEGGMDGWMDEQTD